MKNPIRLTDWQIKTNVKKFKTEKKRFKDTVSFTKDVLKDRFIKMAQDSGVFGVVHDLTKNTNLPPVSAFSLLYQFFPTFFMFPKPILI